VTVRLRDFAHEWDLPPLEASSALTLLDAPPAFLPAEDALFYRTHCAVLAVAPAHPAISSSAETAAAETEAAVTEAAARAAAKEVAATEAAARAAVAKAARAPAPPPPPPPPDLEKLMLAAERRMRFATTQHWLLQAWLAAARDAFAQQ